MNPFVAFLRLIRWPNLIIVALTMYAMRWFVMAPLILKMNVQLVSEYPTRYDGIHTIGFYLSELQFFLLVFSTLCIASAGYIINDYFDTRIDRVNKPQRVVIDVYIKRRVAMLSHILLNVVGVGLAALISFQLGFWKLTLVHAFCAAGLWYYSTTFKRQLIIGNLLISLFSALVPLMVVLYELPLLQLKYLWLTKCCFVSFSELFYMVGTFSFFAFFTTLIREIIKDAEDVEGDAQYGRNTIPVVWGISITRYLILTLILFTCFVLFKLQFNYFFIDYPINFWYLIAFVQLPLLFLGYKVFRGNSPLQWNKANSIAKLVMVFGVLFSLVFYATIVFR